MSSASSSTSTLTPAIDTRPEAEPLPSKVGEIGYTAPKSPEIRQLSTNSTPSSPLPARHPADRSDEPAPTASNASPTAPATTTQNSNTTSSSSKKSWTTRFSFGGISAISIFRIILLLMLLGGTGAAWAMTILRFAPQTMDYSSSPPGGSQTSASDANNADNNSDSDDNNNNNNNNAVTGLPAFSSLVIIHISFTVITLVQLLFLERSIFHARAERYLHKHGMPRGAAGASMGIAPWNRPSLPTYAAALTESGVGTGDVEDNLIAIPPPPAYGNTRGSRLLLSGMLRESLIRQLNRSSQRSSTTSALSPASPREMEEGQRSRPLSYDASEEVDNAKRAMDLEVALAKLEHAGMNKAIGSR